MEKFAQPSETIVINGKTFHISRANGKPTIPPIKRRTSNTNFRSVVEDVLDYGDHLELSKDEMIRARGQLANAKTKAKKAGQPLNYGFTFRTEIKDKLYSLYKLTLGMLTWALSIALLLVEIYDYIQ